MLEKEEGRKTLAYLDTNGIFTIGVGHNLRYPISQRVVDLIFKDDLEIHCAIAQKFVGVGRWAEATEIRKLAIVNMAFQLGNRLFRFKETQKLIHDGQWHEAAKEALNSDWAREHPARANRVFKMLTTEEFPY